MQRLQRLVLDRNPRERELQRQNDVRGSNGTHRCFFGSWGRRREERFCIIGSRKSLTDDNSANEQGSRRTRGSRGYSSSRHAHRRGYGTLQRGHRRRSCEHCQVKQRSRQSHRSGRRYCCATRSTTPLGFVAWCPSASSPRSCSPRSWMARAKLARQSGRHQSRRSY